MSGDKVKGPASYFPSIAAKYGRPIAEWQGIVRAARDAQPAAKHMDLVALLKTDFGMGHGHANAIVAYVLAADRS